MTTAPENLTVHDPIVEMARCLPDLFGQQERFEQKEFHSAKDSPERCRYSDAARMASKEIGTTEDLILIKPCTSIAGAVVKVAMAAAELDYALTVTDHDNLVDGARKALLSALTILKDQAGPELQRYVDLYAPEVSLEKS